MCVVCTLHRILEFPGLEHERRRRYEQQHGDQRQASIERVERKNVVERKHKSILTECTQLYPF